MTFTNVIVVNVIKLSYWILFISRWYFSREWWWFYIITRGIPLVIKAFILLLQQWLLLFSQITNLISILTKIGLVLRRALSHAFYILHYLVFHKTRWINRSWARMTISNRRSRCQLSLFLICDRIVILKKWDWIKLCIVNLIPRSFL